MKNIRVIIIAIACVCVICGGFYLFSESLNSGGEEDLTEVEKVIVRDLENNYPKTPREVVKFYNRILSCYYSREIKDDQLEDLVDQMRCLFDEDLLLVNSRAEYLASVKSDIQLYEKQKKYIVEATVCDSNEVRYITDKEEGETEGDELAYVQTSYFIKTDGQFSKTYQDIVLREDAEGHWKLIAFYEVEGENKEDE